MVDGKGLGRNSVLCPHTRPVESSTGLHPWPALATCTPLPHLPASPVPLVRVPDADSSRAQIPWAWDMGRGGWASGTAEGWVNTQVGLLTDPCAGSQQACRVRRGSGWQLLGLQPMLGWDACTHPIQTECFYNPLLQSRMASWRLRDLDSQSRCLLCVS